MSDMMNPTHIRVANAVPDAEFDAEWDACIAPPGWPAARDGIKTLTARGSYKPEDVGNQSGFHLSQIAD